jgi:uncharacterized membrane protein YfcA
MPKITMETLLVLIGIGLAAGIVSGMVGVGGGIVMVPAMVFFLGYSQKDAQGTMLAMLMVPVVFLSVYNYYQAGHVHIKTAALAAIGFVVGGFLGSKFTVLLPETLEIGQYVIQKPVKKIFATVLVVAALRMFFSS